MRKCFRCGCTDERACPGGCYWVDDDLCSQCADIIDGELAREANEVPAGYVERMSGLVVPPAYDELRF